jgi:hypothetical protein
MQARPMKTKNIFILTAVILIISTLTNCTSNSTTEKDLSKIDIKDVNKAELFKISFKEFLKKENISLDVEKPNKYETLQPGNSYTNEYFKITTDFPDWKKIDRGASEFSIFRAINTDSAITVALMAMPIKLKDSSSAKPHEQFQKFPLKTMNDAFGGDYKKYLMNQMTTLSHVEPYDFIISERKIRSTNYLIYSYKYKETVEGHEIPFIIIGYQTILWGVSYTFQYSSPELFQDAKTIEEVVFRTNYINPEI